jgi:16S rRNA C967 or C1407 C5-methylase (RsmB/RsmF family)
MVRDFLKEHEEYELLEEKTLFPFEDDADGFFAARMRRK